MPNSNVSTVFTHWMDSKKNISKNPFNERYGGFFQLANESLLALICC